MRPGLVDGEGAFIITMFTRRLARRRSRSGKKTQTAWADSDCARVGREAVGEAAINLGGPVLFIEARGRARPGLAVVSEHKKLGKPAWTL